MNKTITSCASCGYPLAIENPGDIETCPNCGTINEAIAPDIKAISSGFGSFGWFALGLVIGVIGSAPFKASAKSGFQWIEKKVG